MDRDPPRVAGPPPDHNASQLGGKNAIGKGHPDNNPSHPQTYISLEDYVYVINQSISIISVSVYAER